MIGTKAFAVSLALLAVTFAGPASLRAQTTDYAATAAAQAAANAKPGVRHAPARDVAAPTEGVSPQEQAIIAAPYSPIFNAHPKNATEWKALVDKLAAIGAKSIPALAEKFDVTVTPTTIAGVKCYIVEPKSMPERNRNRLLVHVHGGGYVLGPGLAAAREAILLAGFGGFKVISVDYRMPPDFPYPAAMDDAMAVWKVAVTMADPKNMAIFGTSTGGGMTLAMVLRAKDEHLPLPAAIAPGTPWADLTDTGDSYKTNEWVDNILVTWNGWLGDAAKLYAGSHDLKEPYLSPIYGDFHGFPPAILTTGTRDLFLSNTVRTHRKLRRAGVEADLNVYEGQSHAEYYVNPDAPETKEAMTDIANFFDKHLGH
jgi:epsilon-lactone hydrolase